MTYRAAVCTALDGPGAVRIEARERNPLEPGELRIAVRAAGIGFPDLLMTYGKYQFRPDPPFVPGAEWAGEVIEAGTQFEKFPTGAHVVGGGFGGLSEEIIVRAAALRPLPATMSFEEGACWRSGAVTAWHALHDKAALQAGETVLILGASGGVGLAAVQLAKHRGAIVIGLGSTEAKRNAILAAGADHALDPAEPDLPAKVKALSGGAGADVVYDPVGGDLANLATRAIAYGGRYLIVGFASGTVPSFPANHALIKGYSLIGLRAGESSRRDPALAARTEKALADLAERGIMRPHISHRFPLEHAASALRAIENREVIGRAVVVV